MQAIVISAGSENVDRRDGDCEWVDVRPCYHLIVDGAVVAPENQSREHFTSGELTKKIAEFQKEYRDSLKITYIG